MALQGNERMRQRKGHRSQRIIELDIGAKIDRHRLEQIRLRPRNAQPVEHRVDADRTAIALKVGTETAELHGAGIQRIDANLPRGVRALERSVHMRLQRYFLPGQVLPRRHRRRAGRQVEIHDLLHQIHFAHAGSAQRPRDDGKPHCFRVTRTLEAPLNRKSAEIGQLRQPGEQTLRGLADVDLDFDIRRIDASVELVGSGRVQPVRRQRGFGLLQRGCVHVALDGHRGRRAGDPCVDIQPIDPGLGNVDAQRQFG